MSAHLAGLGRTPLDWLDQAAPSVSRAAVRNLIAPRE